MSTAIGFGFKNIQTDSFYEEIKSIADQYGYGIVNNLDAAENDMKTGLSELFAALEWSSIVLLKTPKDNTAALAFEIQEDLGKWECENLRPIFYDFLLFVSLVLKKYCEEFCVFFSGEWYEGDRVRMEEGYIEDLLIFLRKPANWNERLYVPKSRRYQYSDEVPLIYRVKT